MKPYCKVLPFINCLHVISVVIHMISERLTHDFRAHLTRRNDISLHQNTKYLLRTAPTVIRLNDIIVKLKFQSC